MPIPPGQDVDTPPDFREQGEQLAFGSTEPKVLERQGTFMTSWVRESVAWIVKFLIQNASWAAIWFAERIMTAEDRNAPAFAALTRTAIRDLTGADAGAGHAAIGRTLMQSLSGGAGAQAGGTLEPSTAGAEKYMEIVMQLALESYIEGGITSALSAGFLDKFTELDDILASVLGLGRMSRAVMRPLMGAKVITPFQWHVNKQYRPELLSSAATVEAFLAGRYTGPQLQEELARQGWSDERINILVANARKRLSFADLVYQFFRGALSDLEVIARAGELGYDEVTARQLLDIETAKRQDRWKDPLTDAAVAAFIDGEIDEAELRRLVEANAPSYAEAQFIILTATTRRGYKRRHLSSGDVRRLVVKGVLSVIDYRRALERENWKFEAIDALDLELRGDLADIRDAAARRAEQEAAREAEKAAAAEAKRLRDEALAARNALPALNEYRRAYVRGLISRDAFASALAREKIAITAEDLAVLLADADVDRSTYLENLERREAVKARELDPVLPLEKYEASVLAGVLTFEQYARALVERGYDADEQQILTALLADRIDKRKEAQAQRDAAAARADEARRAAEERAKALEGREAERARRAGVTLADFERAVRLGVRTRDQYAAWLTSIETSDVGRALILDLLDAQIREDAAARTRREQADRTIVPPGLTLSQRRRIVLAGARPRAYYEDALRTAKYSTDDQLADLALLDLELAEEAAARARRAEIVAAREAERIAREDAAILAADAVGAPPPAPTLSIAQLERAVKLGLLPPDALRDALAAAGTDTADVELLVALTVGQVPDTRVAERRWTTVAGEIATKGVGLADFERAVKAGFRTLDDYSAMLSQHGYGGDDELLLRMLLEDEIALEQLKLRAAIEARLKKMDTAPPLAEIHDAVVAGELTVAQLRDVLVRFGVDTVTALLYARLVFAFGPES